MLHYVKARAHDASSQARTVSQASTVPVCIAIPRQHNNVKPAFETGQSIDTQANFSRQ